MTSVAGHVFSRDFPQSYSNWEGTNPIELFDADTVKVEANPSAKVITHLQKEARDCDYLILWLDNDKEGENICFEVIDSCTQQMR